MPIKHLPHQLRPREKCLRLGAENLSDIELLAIFLRSGQHQQDVIDLAKKIWQRFGTYTTLASLGITDWHQIYGIGLVKAIELKALFELSRRISKTAEGKRIDNDFQAANFARWKIAAKNQEQFLVVLLDQKNVILYWETIYKGTHSFVSIEPAKIIGIVLSFQARRFYCFHNHPSGKTNPSPADRMITSKIVQCAKIFGIQLLGHIVVCADGSYQKI